VDFRDLPTLPAGVWLHHKGPCYQAFGYAPDKAQDGRIVVVYVGLDLAGAARGLRMLVRTAISDDPADRAWWDWVHPDGGKCIHRGRPVRSPSCRGGLCYAGLRIRPRFTYSGPGWDPGPGG
jgi:hypothetical protein